MDNNKLGLKIVRINQGYTDLFEINGDQVWTKNVWDIRKDLENIDNLDGSSAVLMLTSVDIGHILTVASLIEGRITDCISAWIYVPASINIAGKELVEIVETSEQVSQLGFMPVWDMTQSMFGDATARYVAYWDAARL